MKMSELENKNAFSTGNFPTALEYSRVCIGFSDVLVLILILALNLTVSPHF